MKQTKTTAISEQKQAKNKNTFADLLRQYEQQATTPTSTADYNKSLINLGTACTYSVLKKCIDVSNNKQLRTVKNSITKDRNNLDKIKYITDTAYTTEYNQGGDLVTIVTDKQLDSDMDKIINDCIGDGYDLVNDCIIAILEQTEQARERNGGVLVVEFMEIPYTIRRLKKKVYIKSADSVNGWETVETTPIQEVYKAVRRSVEQSRAVQVAQNGYTYLDELATDSETDAETVIYRRFGKYADIGGAITDYNGKETAYTTDRQTVQEIDEIITRLNLTQRQLTVLNLRMQGYGYKAIATYTGIAESSIKRVCRQIQTKCINIGLVQNK